MRGGRLIAAMRGWDLSLSRRITRTDSALLDRILLPLTRAADRSVLWMGMAVPLAVLGGRFGRRAAVRGLMSIALTSAIVNVPGKLAFRRPRPIDVLPRTAALRRRPVSHSFPSGHTASAFAFATGVSLEAPRLGAPLWVLTVGVAASRIYTGLHYPSDVLVGATIGAGIALGSRRLWPVAEQDPAEIRAAAPRSAADPSPEGRGITFVVNPSAGPALAPDPVDELREALPQANIIEAGDKADFDEALKAAAEGGQAIGVAGGDGSVNVAAEAAIKNRRPLVIVPAGTLNHLARDLGLSTVRDTIDAVQRGQAAAVDVATIDGKPFLNTASFGSYVELVDAREKLESKIGKWPAVVVALVRVLRSADPVDVEINGRRRKIWMIFIGNCRYHPSGFAPGWRERPDDGLLDVRILDGHQPWSGCAFCLPCSRAPWAGAGHTSTAL